MFQQEGFALLVLKRQLTDRVAVGDDVIVQVLEIGRGWVRLGFVTPKGVKIDREEILTAEQMKAVEDRATEKVK